MCVCVCVCVVCVFTGSRKDYQSVKMACKKVYFLTIWALHNIDDLQCLARIVDIEHGMIVALDLLSVCVCVLQKQVPGAGRR